LPSVSKRTNCFKGDQVTTSQQTDSGTTRTINQPLASQEVALQEPSGQPPASPPPASQVALQEPASQPPASQHDRFWSKVQQTRAWAGVLVVAVAVAAIALASYWGVTRAAGARDASSIVAILSSGFTAIATATTAYFGIRATANTAQSFAEGKSTGGTSGSGTSGSGTSGGPS
jgi:hypothetical protein